MTIFHSSYPSHFSPRPIPEELITTVRPRIVRQPSAEIFIDRGLPIPDRYDQDNVMLLVQEPHMLFAYWEISAETAEASGLISGECLELRLHDLETGTTVSADAGFTDTWWFQVAAARTYACSLGIQRRDGFVEIVRSNTVRTPRGRIARRADADPTWAIGGWRFLRVLRAAGLEFEKLPPEWLLGIPRDIQEALAAEAGVSVDEAVRAWTEKVNRERVAEETPPTSAGDGWLGPSSPAGSRHLV